MSHDRGRIERWRAPAFAAALAVGACGDGAPGDLEKVPPTQPNILGNGTRIATLNDPATNPPDDTDVFVTAAAIVIVDEFDETANGSSAGNVFVQDLPVEGNTPPYGGLTLFNSSFSPPTLQVGPGDVVDIRGTYDEFEGPSSSPFKPGQDLPEIVSGTITLRFEYKPPVPITIPASDLASYETGRKWIGVLARIENVKCVAEQGTTPPTCGRNVNGRYDIKLDVPGASSVTIGNDLFDLEKSGLPVAGDSVYKSVTGVVQYFFSFSITPRSIEDIEL